MVSYRELRDAAARLAPRLVELRRDIHRHPELAWQEHRTSDLVARALSECGIAVRRGVGGTGVVGLVGDPTRGRCVALRADMDALPIQELTDAEYASVVHGVMHACGHDVHTACLLGAAMLLAERSDRLPGAVKLIFQPSEELVSGAEAMINEGVLESPPVEACVGFHVIGMLDAPILGFSYGTRMAGTTVFEITVNGRSGHAGYPQDAVDAIPIAAQVVCALQTVVSRRVAPWEPAVLSIGVLRGGERPNIIADKVRLEGTLRFYDGSLRHQLLGWIEDTAVGVSRAMGGDAEVLVGGATPPLSVDASVTDTVISACSEALGPELVTIHEHRSMGGEDFAFFAARVPSGHFWLGARTPGAEAWPPIHSPHFDADESALPVGAAALAVAAVSLLERRVGG